MTQKSNLPIEADSVRLSPGQQIQSLKYPKYLYVTTCGDPGCTVEIHFDQLPPTVCQHGRKYYLDRDYEAAKRITATNPHGKPLPLIQESSGPKVIIDFIKLWKHREEEPLPALAVPADPPEPEIPIDTELNDIFGP